MGNHFCKPTTLETSHHANHGDENHAPATDTTPLLANATPPSTTSFTLTTTPAWAQLIPQVTAKIGLISLDLSIVKPKRTITHYLIPTTPEERREQNLRQLAKSLKNTAYDIENKINSQALLPNELWVHVIKFLDLKSLIELELTCKFFASIILLTKELRVKLAKKPPFFEHNLNTRLIADLTTHNPIYQPLNPNLLNQIVVAPAGPAELYNDQPSGFGFVMKQ